MHKLSRGLFSVRLEYYINYNVQGQSRYSMATTKIRSELVSCVSPSSGTGYISGNNFPTFIMARN